MPTTVFGTALNQLSTTLGSAHVASSGTLVLATGYGATIAAEIAAEGLPSISSGHPIRVSVVALAHKNDSPIAPAYRTVFLATGLSGDTLTGCTAIEGTTDRDYARGSPARFNVTAGTINDLNAAVNANETALADKQDTGGPLATRSDASAAAGSIFLGSDHADVPCWKDASGTVYLLSYASPWSPATPAGLAAWLDPSASGVLFSDQSGSTPASGAGSLVRHISGVGGRGSASGNPAAAEAARIDTASYPGATAIYCGGGTGVTPFSTLAGLAGTGQSFTLAIDYCFISAFSSQSPGTITGSPYGVYEAWNGNRLMSMTNRFNFSGLTSGIFGPGRRRLIIRGTPSAMKFRVDGVDYADVAGSTAAIAAGVIGNDAPGVNPMQMVLREYLEYSRDLTDAEVNSLDAYWQARPAPSPLPASLPAIVCDGNSLVAGFGTSPPTNWPWLMESAIGRSNCRVMNLGAIGFQTPQLASGAAILVDVWAATRPGNVVVVQEGTNHIISGSADAATAYGAFTSYLAARQAAWPSGTKFVLCTIPPATAIAGSAETARVGGNSSLRANWASRGAHGLIDWETDSRLSDPTDTTYYNVDGVHWTGTGQAVAAGLAAAVVGPLL